MFRKFFTAETAYKENIVQYKTADGILAISFYILFLIAYYIVGVLYAKKGIYVGVPVNLILMLICLVIVRARKQTIASIGLTLCNAKKSILCGFILGVCIFLLNLLPAILSGSEYIGYGKMLYNIFFYFIIIGFIEEVVFRGYIQTRLYGIIKFDVLTIIIGGVLFSVMHVPFQMYSHNMSLFSYLQNNYIPLLLLVFWHILFNFLYRKYNSLMAPTLLHGLMDFSGNLFR